MFQLATSELTSSPWFTWLILPLTIFLARTLDMSLSTLRIVFVSQGKTKLAPLVGFFEALLWLLIMGQVLRQLGNPLCYIAYAGGFAAGNSLGLFLERRLAIGTRIVRIIPQGDAEILAQRLREAGVGLTVVDGHGAQGPVRILFTLLRRRDVEHILELVREHNPLAFYSIEDVRQATDHSVYPVLDGRTRRSWMQWRSMRKTK